MRIPTVLRVRELVRAVVRKVRRAAVLVLVLGLLASAVAVGKNAFLAGVGRQVRKSFAYDRMRLTAFPPALTIDNLRSLAGPPTLKVRRVRVELPFLSLVRNRRVFRVSLIAPELRLTPGAGPRRRERPATFAALPFSIERGVIEDGLVLFETAKAALEVRDLRGLVTQRGEAFTVRATAGRAGYLSRTPEIELGGALDLVLTGRGESVTVQRLSLRGPEVRLEADGAFQRLLDPDGEVRVRFSVETSLLDAIMRMPFDWQGPITGDGTVRRRSGAISGEASLEAGELELCGVPMGRIKGRLELGGGRGGRVELGLQKPGRAAETLILSFAGGRVEGQAAPVFLDPVFRELEIPWPVGSPAWGTFVLADRRLSVEAEFRDRELGHEGDRFSFRGAAQVGVDFPKKRIAIRTAGLESEFGRLEASGDIDLAGDMGLRIRGSIYDAAETRDFVSLALGQKLDFGQIRGAGYADVKISGPSRSPAVDLKATLTPGGFERFDAASVEADVKVSSMGVEGVFLVEDPNLRGRVEVRSAGDRTEVRVAGGEGELAEVLAGLDVPAALSGRVSGDFEMIVENGREEFRGSFRSPAVRGYGEEAGPVEGRLEWKDSRLAFPELRMGFYGGTIDGRLAVGIERGDFDFDLRGEELDFGRVVPGASGRLSMALRGQGVFGEERLGGLFSVKDMVLSPLGKSEARGTAEINAIEGTISVGLKGEIVPGNDPFTARLEFPLSGAPFSGTVEGHIANLNLVVPWPGARGRIGYQARVRGAEGEGPAHVEVDLEMDASVMPLPGFAYALEGFRASARYDDGALAVSSLQGRLGGGEVTGSGRVELADGAVTAMDMRFEAKDMVLSPMERTRAQADASLRLLKDAQRFVTEGEILFKRLNWRREIYEEFGFSTVAERGPTEGPSFFDGMALNIRLRADDGFAIENSLGRFSGRFNLVAAGPFEAPVLLGDIDILSGDFFFQDRAFRVIQGRLSFTDPLNTEPLLDFRGETYVKDYRVTLSMSGPVSRLRPEFSSSPPLPPEEILSLLALGESFRRTYYTYSGDRSTALNTASLLTYQIADQAKRRTSGLFSLDRFRIDPYMPESAPGGIAARVTVGKKISRSLLVLYSTVLANSTVLAQIDEVPIFRMEWDISRKFSLVGGRDDRGRLSFDVKFRKRF